MHLAPPATVEPRTRSATEPSALAHSRATVVLVCVGMFMTTLDASIVNIGLPTIAHAFGTSLGGAVEWVIIGYLVVIASLLLTIGRLSDMVGRPRIWMAGLAVFTVGSAVCGAAPSLALLIAARGLQGVGAALILATSTAILTDAVGPAQRGRALGWSAVAIAFGVSTGPTIGGLLTEYLSWRWIFYVNLPIGLGALGIAHRLLPRDARRTRVRFDVPGALLLAVGVAALNLGVSFGSTWGWRSARLLGTMALGVGALAAAVAIERRTTAPAMDVHLVRNRVFVSALASMVFSMMALFAVGFLLPFYFEELRGYSSARAGVLLTPFAITVGVVAPVAGTMADRYGSRWLAPLGLAIATVGLLLLARLEPASAIADVAWRLVVVGFGQGLFQSPNTRALMSAAPAAEQGEASGLLAMARVSGQALSVGVAGAVFTSLGGAAAGNTLLSARTHAQQLGAAERAALRDTFIHAFHDAFILCAAFAAAGALTALVRGREH